MGGEGKRTGEIRKESRHSLKIKREKQNGHCRKREELIWWESCPISRKESSFGVEEMDFKQETPGGGTKGGHRKSGAEKGIFHTPEMHSKGHLGQHGYFVHI